LTDKGEKSVQTTVSYQCPNCEAPLTFDPASQNFRCEYCGSSFAEEELRRLDAQRAARRQEEESNASAEYCEQMEEYECPNCGAQVACDANTVADFCCFCHTPVIHRGKLSGQMRPNRIVPFRFDREQAEKMFLDFAHKHKFIPRAFFAKSQLEKMQGVYYPFWITDADTHANLEADATRVRSWRAGDFRYTETSFFRVERGGEIHFEDITTSALSEGDKKMLEGVLPYPSDALADFSMPYLSGFLTKKRDIEREALEEEVTGRMRTYSQQILRDTVHGYTTVSVRNTSMTPYREGWEYALMPVWILVWQGKKRKYTYAMNGYTGKIYGELPISPGKVAALAGGVFAAATAAVTLIGGLLG
jgi:hypothetical protein